MGEQDFAGTARFRVLARLGAGGMGVVYRVRDQEQGREVALKTLQRFDPAELYKLKQEFRALCGVVHPNLVSLYELTSEGDRRFFTMELVEGVSFRAWVRRSDPGGSADLVSGADSASEQVRSVTRSLERQTPSAAPPHAAMGLSVRPPPPCDLDRLRSALRQLASAVHALHRSGWVHRDIKPSNVLVTHEGRVVLLDFGLVSERRSRGLRDTLDESLHGTPAYMSPEQAACAQVGPASDWYSIGVLLYEALTGRLPFEGTVAGVLIDKQHTDPAPPSQVASVPADLDALCMALLRRRPQDRPNAQEILAQLGATHPTNVPVEAPTVESPTIFVGREAELDTLRQTYAAAREGSGLTLHVHGRSGIGKTALITRFLDLVRGDGDATILAGRCYERETVPYKGIDSLIDALSRHLRHLHERGSALLPRDVGTLVRLFPVLGQAEAVATAPLRATEISDAQELRRRAFASLKELLARIADRGPLVLWVDDLQWGDLDSAALLTQLMHPPDAPAALLVLSYRREDIASSACVRAMREQASTAEAVLRELPVDALRPEEARALAMAMLPRPDVHRALHVAQEAEGHPLFVAELARYGSAEAATLEDVLRSRVAQLEPKARQLLEVISVAGGPIEAESAYRAAGTCDPLGTLAVLRAGSLVRAAGAGDHLEAYHDRVRETVTKHLDAMRTRECHVALSRALESSGHADPEALAIHLREAGDTTNAGRYAALAAAQANSALAFDRAARLYRLALELARGGRDSERRLQVKLGDALANAGRGAEAARAYLAAADGADAGEALELRRRAMEQFLRSGHLPDGLATAQTVLQAVGMKMPTTRARAIASYLARRGQVRARGLRYRERDASQIAPDELTRIDICCSVANGLMIDFLRGPVFQTRHLLLALRAGEPSRVARALALEAGFSSLVGKRERAKELLERAQSLAQRIGYTYGVALVALQAGLAAFDAGQFRQSCEHCARAVKILHDQSIPTSWEIATAHAFMLRCLSWLGKLVEQAGIVEDALARAEDHGDLYAATVLRTYLAFNLFLKDDDLPRARRQLDDAMARWPVSGASSFQIPHLEELVMRTWSDLYAGDNAAAWDRLQARWPALRRSMLLRMQLIRILMLYQRAQCALAVAADGVVAERHLRAAARDARRIERERVPWGVALARLLRAGIANVRRDAPAAIRDLESAEKAFTANDMLLLAAIARRRRGALFGGEEGKALIASAEEWIATERIRSPARASAMWAPGFVN